MKRRAFLKLGAFAPAMLALQQLPARAAWSQAGAGPPPEPTHNSVDPLNDDDADRLMAVVSRMVETGEPSAPHPREIGTLGAIQAVLELLDSELVDQLRVALRLVEYWPVLMEWRLRRFRSLSPEQQDESLEGWRTSRIEARRRVFYALRNLALLGYWSQDETWPLIGYGGPWLGGKPS
jgi:hypothetical protein